MSTCRWLFIGITLLLSACGGKLQPHLELHGYWRVDHGFDDNCQVTATFHDNQVMVLGFYDLVEGACQLEHYGIEGTATMFDITSKKDYFDNEGALATELQVQGFIHRQTVKGVMRLTETVTGMRAVMTAVDGDANGLLGPLHNTDLTLTAAPTDWLQSLQGPWGAGCDPVGSDLCEVLEFRSYLLRVTTTYRDCDSALECSSASIPNYFVYVIRNFEKLDDDRYRVDIVVLGPGSDANPNGITSTIILSDENLEFVEYEGKYTRLKKLPVVVQ